VLREVGFLLKRTVDREGAILSRYGGDEFVIGLPDTPLAGSCEIGERVRAAIAGTTFLDRSHGESLPALFLTGVVSASVGVASYVPRGSPAPAHEKESDLLRRSDAAMYAAKARGKNCVVCDAEA
jgi:diguanylate cyclase